MHPFTLISERGDTHTVVGLVDTGATFSAVPREQLRAETVALAQRLMKINPEAIRATKQAVKNVRNMSDDAAVDYLAAKSLELRFLDSEKGREKGMSQFLDEKTYRPGIQPYNRPSEKAS